MTSPDHLGEASPPGVAVRAIGWTLTALLTFPLLAWLEGRSPLRGVATALVAGPLAGWIVERRVSGPRAATGRWSGGGSPA